MRSERASLLFRFLVSQLFIPANLESLELIKEHKKVDALEILDTPGCKLLLCKAYWTKWALWDIAKLPFISVGHMLLVDFAAANIN